MNCPICSAPAIKRGVFIRSSDRRHIQRFHCKKCNKSFSTQTLNFDYRLRKRSHNQLVFRLICSGLSQRRCALLLGLKQESIARRVRLFGNTSKMNLKAYRKNRSKIKIINIDEMETFEHTKCKPLTLPIAVEEKTRKIVALGVAPIAAKGRLAMVSRKKYGRRECRRSQVLDQVFTDLKDCCTEKTKFKSDESIHYPKRIKKFFHSAPHTVFKGLRGCVTGQGELKSARFDPLFTLNHTYAMFRDNLNTLARRTWCTCKKPKMLEHLLYMYSWFHNLYLDNPRRIILSKYMS